MKKYKILFLLPLIIIFINTTSCSFNTTQTKEVSAGFNDSTLIVSKKALHFVQSENLDSLKTLLSPQLIRTVNDKQWMKIIEATKKIIDNSTFPENTELQVTYKKSKSVLTGENNITTYTFPFPNEEKQNEKKSIQISINDNNQITQFLINTTRTSIIN